MCDAVRIPQGLPSLRFRGVFIRLGEYTGLRNKGALPLRSLLNKFSYKVLGLALLVVLGSQAATVITVLNFAAAENRRIAQEELDEATWVFTNGNNHRADALADVLLGIADDPHIGLAMTNERNLDALRGRFDRAMEQTSTDVGIVYRPDGSPLIRRGAGQSDLAAFAENYTEPRRIVMTNDGAYDTVVVPVGPSADIGHLMLAYRIDDDIANRMRESTGMDVSFLRSTGTPGPEILGSSLPQEDRLMVELAAADVRGGTSDQPDGPFSDLSDRFKHAGFGYLGGNESVGVLVLLHKRVEESRRPFVALRGAMTHAAAVSILGALILALLMSRAVTQPVRQLLMAARRMSVGNYTKKLKISSNDEFGELAEAFEKMRTGIAEREQRIVYQAEFDALTGLPNRIHAMELLRESLRNASKNGDPLVVMVMHLQRFREIQSSLGHEIGDEVLRQTAQRMRSTLDDSHILARLEGDQFLVVAPDTSKDEGKRLARQLAGMLDAGLNVQSVNVTLDACIGFCVSPEHGRQPDELLRRAAVAKNDAQQGQKRIRIYQNGREARHVRQLAILGDLRRATRENELELYLQPKVELGNTQVCGAEALLRWNHPELGQIAPYEFIPLAERAGCIGMITEWMLARAVAQARLWRDQGIDLPIAVNLSAQDLLGDNLIALIEQELDANRMDASCLILEITEEALVHDLEYAVRILERLREMGAKTSMDDFGTGYSSLAHLQQMPVNELKVDRAFVMSLPDDQHNTAIVRAIIDMAHNLGIEVVAEGVETTACLRWLREAGCERAQGYYLSKPMPCDEFIGWMRDWESLAREDIAGHVDMTDSLILRPRLIT